MTAGSLGLRAEITAQGRVHALMTEVLREGRVGAGILLDHNLSDRVAEQMNVHFQAGPFLDALGDGGPHCAVRPRSAVLACEQVGTIRAGQTRSVDFQELRQCLGCLLYTSDAADE